MDIPLTVVNSFSNILSAIYHYYHYGAPNKSVAWSKLDSAEVLFG
jgi:hypothetical protein